MTLSTAALPITWIILLALSAADKPCQRLTPEPGISGPRGEFGRQPMRPDVRSPCKGAALAEGPRDEQRLAVIVGRSGREHIGAWLRLDFVEAEQRRPVAGKAGENRVRLPLDDGHESFRDLDPIVIGKDLDRQNLLDRRAMIARPAVDALEAVVAPDHQESSATLDVSL